MGGVGLKKYRGVMPIALAWCFQGPSSHPKPDQRDESVDLGIGRRIHRDESWPSLGG